ncbi:MAG: inositol monophosphatase family protein [Miltoncostaeaceae bacterium]
MRSNRWPTDPDDAAWVEVLTRAADRAAEAVAAIPPGDLGMEVGRGEGGDTTLVIDRDAESAIIEVLEQAHAQGMRFDLISEEVGHRGFDGDGTLVIVDPIDGSRNARRGLPEVAVSLAVTDGPRLSDARVGVLRHLGTGETVVAVRGEGVRVDGAPMPGRPYRGLWLTVVEGASPRRLAAAMQHLSHTSRIRSLGSLALSIQHVALGRLDGLAVLRPGRVVDIAAAMLIAREAGVIVTDEHGAALDAEADMDWRGAMAVARVPDDVAPLTAAVRAALDAGKRGT